MCLHFLVHFDEGFGKTVLYKHKSKLGAPLGFAGRGGVVSLPEEGKGLLIFL